MGNDENGKDLDVAPSTPPSDKPKPLPDVIVHAKKRIESLIIFTIDLLYVSAFYIIAIFIGDIVMFFLKMSMGSILETSSEVATLFTWIEERIAIATIVAYAAYAVYAIGNQVIKLIRLEHNPDVPLN